MGLSVDFSRQLLYEQSEKLDLWLDGLWFDIDLSSCIEPIYPRRSSLSPVSFMLCGQGGQFCAASPEPKWWLYQ